MINGQKIIIDFLLTTWIKNNQKSYGFIYNNYDLNIIQVIIIHYHTLIIKN